MSVRTTGMRLSIRPNHSVHNRVVVIPAKGFRTAVARNRCRRRACEAFRALKPEIKSGFDIVIVAYPGEYAFIDRKMQLAGLLARTHLLLSKSAKER
jgi:ribonuclease P protein component